jgi:hypothetical protein
VVKMTSVGFDVKHSCWWLPTFRRNLLPPFSGYNVTKLRHSQKILQLTLSGVLLTSNKDSFPNEINITLHKSLFPLLPLKHF